MGFQTKGIATKEICNINENIQLNDIIKTKEALIKAQEDRINLIGFEKL
jgi:hypothetical protein